MEYLHFDLFFRDPVWIVAHNFFHAPLVLAAIGGLGIWLRRQGNRWAQPLIWFALGAGLHTVIDIFTHTSDGPLLFFPLNWSYRFPSPVSYWEGSTGRFFALFEWILDGSLLLYFALDWWRRRRREETA